MASLLDIEELRSSLHPDGGCDGAGEIELAQFNMMETTQDAMGGRGETDNDTKK